MRYQFYDLIGDIHGHYDKLTALLNRLGYFAYENYYRHPDERRVIFLGDYIDRGPKIRETLQLVRAMVDAGQALAIMGNHELNAIQFHTRDGKGGWLRERNQKNAKCHAATFAAFRGRKDEWLRWIEWMKRLHLSLSMRDLHVAHAAWDDRHIDVIGNNTLWDEEFLLASGTRGTPEYEAVEMTLKGPELWLPEGVTFFDAEGIERNKVRVRWWNIEEGMPIGDLTMPVKMDVPHPLHRRHMRELPNYPANAPPVFVGHYGVPPDAPKEPLAPNVVCLDYSAGLGPGPLYAYRWDGEARPTAEKFVSSARITSPTWP